MEVDLIFKIAAVGIIVAIINQLLSRSGKEEYAMITTIAGLVAAMLMIIPKITALFEAVKSAFDF